MLLRMVILRRASTTGSTKQATAEQWGCSTRRRCGAGRHRTACAVDLKRRDETARGPAALTETSHRFCLEHTVKCREIPADASARCGPRRQFRRKGHAGTPASSPNTDNRATWDPLAAEARDPRRRRRASSTTRSQTRSNDRSGRATTRGGSRGAGRRALDSSL